MQIERYTLGQIREAGRALGDGTLLRRVVAGEKLASYAACRFLTVQTEDCMQCPERAECHRALPGEVVLHGS